METSIEREIDFILPLEKTYAARSIFQSYFQQSRAESGVVISHALIALSYLVLYAVETFNSYDVLTIRITLASIGVVLLAYTGFWLWASPLIPREIAGWGIFVSDLIAIVPTFVAAFIPSYDITFEFFIAIRLFTLLHSRFSLWNSRLLGRVISFAALIVMIIIIFGGIFRLIETVIYEAQELNFVDSFYFGTVTVITIGYGDIVPLTTVGKVVVALFIFLTFAVIPFEVSRLSRVADKTKKYGKTSPTTKAPMIVVVGRPSTTQGYGSFLSEFFHSSHGPRPEKVLFISPESPEEDVKNFVKRFRSSGYYKASLRDATEQLSLSNVKAVFFFSANISTDIQLMYNALNMRETTQALLDKKREEERLKEKEEERELRIVLREKRDKERRKRKRHKADLNTLQRWAQEDHEWRQKERARRQKVQEKIDLRDSEQTLQLVPFYGCLFRGDLLPHSKTIGFTSVSSLKEIELMLVAAGCEVEGCVCILQNLMRSFAPSDFVEMRKDIEKGIKQKSKRRDRRKKKKKLRVERRKKKEKKSRIKREKHALEKRITRESREERRVRRQRKKEERRHQMLFEGGPQVIVDDVDLEEAGFDGSEEEEEEEESSYDLSSSSDTDYRSHTDSYSYGGSDEYSEHSFDTQFSLDYDEKHSQDGVPQIASDKRSTDMPSRVPERNGQAPVITDQSVQKSGTQPFAPSENTISSTTSKKHQKRRRRSTGSGTVGGGHHHRRSHDTRITSKGKPTKHGVSADTQPAETQGKKKISVSRQHEASLHDSEDASQSSIKSSTSSQSIREHTQSQLDIWDMYTQIHHRTSFEMRKRGPTLQSRLSEIHKAQRKQFNSQLKKRKRSLRQSSQLSQLSLPLTSSHTFSYPISHHRRNTSIEDFPLLSKKLFEKEAVDGKSKSKITPRSTSTGADRYQHPNSVVTTSRIPIHGSTESNGFLFGPDTGSSQLSPGSNSLLFPSERHGPSRRATTIALPCDMRYDRPSGWSEGAKPQETRKKSPRLALEEIFRLSPPMEHNKSEEEEEEKVGITPDDQRKTVFQHSLPQPVATTTQRSVRSDGDKIILKIPTCDASGKLVGLTRSVDLGSYSSSSKTQKISEDQSPPVENTSPHLSDFVSPISKPSKSTASLLEGYNEKSSTHNGTSHRHHGASKEPISTSVPSSHHSHHRLKIPHTRTPKLSDLSIGSEHAELESLEQSLAMSILSLADKDQRFFDKEAGRFTGRLEVHQKDRRERERRRKQRHIDKINRRAEMRRAQRMKAADSKILQPTTVASHPPPSSSMFSAKSAGLGPSPSNLHSALPPGSGSVTVTKKHTR
ncbi:Two pore domain potassium channel like protein, partial [Aduncisulcus paluster]